MTMLKLLLRLFLLILPAIFIRNVYCQEIPSHVDGVHVGNLFFKLSVTQELIDSAEDYELYFLPTKDINFAIVFFDGRGRMIGKPVRNRIFFSENWSNFEPGDYTLSILSLEKEPLIKFLYAAGMATKKTRRVIRKKCTNVCPPKGRKDFNVHYVLDLRAEVESKIRSVATGKYIWNGKFGQKPSGTNSFAWDGKQDSGKHADHGEYKVEIKATDVNDKTNVQYDISRVIWVDPATP